RLVHMSTAVVHGRRLPHAVEQLQEATPLRPVGEPYADEKAAAEAIVRRAGLQAHLLRPHIVYGPGMRWSGDLMELLGRAALPLVGDGGWCTLIHVDDLIDAVGCALGAERGFGEPFYITDGAPLRWRDYILAHAALVGADPPRQRTCDILPHTRTAREW